MREDICKSQECLNILEKMKLKKEKDFIKYETICPHRFLEMFYKIIQDDKQGYFIANTHTRNLVSIATKMLGCSSLVQISDKKRVLCINNDVLFYKLSKKFTQERSLAILQNEKQRERASIEFSFADCHWKQDLSLNMLESGIIEHDLLEDDYTKYSVIGLLFTNSRKKEMIKEFERENDLWDEFSQQAFCDYSEDLLMNSDESRNTRQTLSPSVFGRKF